MLLLWFCLQDMIEQYEIQDNADVFNFFFQYKTLLRVLVFPYGLILMKQLLSIYTGLLTNRSSNIFCLKSFTMPTLPPLFFVFFSKDSHQFIFRAVEINGQWTLHVKAIVVMNLKCRLSNFWSVIVHKSATNKIYSIFFSWRLFFTFHWPAARFKVAKVYQFLL